MRRSLFPGAVERNYLCRSSTGYHCCDTPVDSCWSTVVAVNTTQSAPGHEAGNDAPCGVLPALVSNTSCPGGKVSHDRLPQAVMRPSRRVSCCRSWSLSYAFEGTDIVGSVAMGPHSEESSIDDAIRLLLYVVKHLVTMLTPVLVWNMRAAETQHYVPGKTELSASLVLHDLFSLEWSAREDCEPRSSEGSHTATYFG
ncbi:hypothetical protein PsYK624_048810 [Phanerochaete sordida]|uniref:Uncharacterized protein n=1 Tax=Phanerochaete sordida TaxID=48140 RepID=A0A9P3LBQ6_9APHY|nr:hypothetical protein PsYK624_048810 [Phanerochaete sordida]